MKLRQLAHEVELENYRQTIAERIDVLLPLEYLKQGDVFGFFNDDEKLCGGFSLINHGPYRVLESIPNFKGLTFDPSLKHTAEITGVWLSSQNRTQFSSLQFWSTVIYKVLTSKKKYFVYAYSSRKKGLKNIYSKTRPEVLFRGETKILEGMPAPDHESVEVFFKSRLALEIFKNPDFFFQRLPLKTFRNKFKPKEIYDFKDLSLLPVTSSLVELWSRES